MLFQQPNRLEQTDPSTQTLTDNENALVQVCDTEGFLVGSTCEMDSYQAQAEIGDKTNRNRVVVISQFFGPDSSAVGQLLTDFASGVSETGHDVLVICGATEYAAHDFEAVHGTKCRQSGKVNTSEFGVGHGEIAVERLRTATFSQSKFKKLISYATFYVGAIWRSLTIAKPNVVVTLTAPPGLAWIGWLMQRLRGCRHVVWEMDVYPDIAVSLGMTFAGWFSEFLDFPRRRADSVVALGECMKSRLLQHRIRQDRISVAENWADGHIISQRPFPASRPLRILYSGNLGLAHDVATIRGVIQRLANDPAFLLVFAGGGLQRQELMRFCGDHGITNVSFRSYARQEDLGEHLAECHIGLVTQKTATLGAVVPSKIYGLMAAGRPVLYIGPAAATPSTLIRKFDCGWQFACGDEAGVFELLTHLLEQPEEIVIKGQQGRRGFVENYDKPAGVARVIRALALEGPASC